MAISSENFISDIVLFLRDKLRDKVTDPLVGRTDSFVMTSYPKRVVQYPIITIKNTNVNTIKLGMSSEMHLAVVDLEVRIWARNAKEVDNLTGEVIDIMRDLQYDSDGTDVEEIFGFTLTSCVPIVEVEGENSIHSKVCSFEYKVILQ